MPRIKLFQMALPSTKPSAKGEMITQVPIVLKSNRPHAPSRPHYGDGGLPGRC